MRAWVLEVGEPLPIDPGSPRLMRAGMLTEQLARRGHEVTWWSAAFDHNRKHMRSVGSHRIRGPGYEYELVTLKGVGYRSHVSLRRIVDHAVNARDFLRQASTRNAPDVICAGLPTTELAAAGARVARRRGSMFVVDVRDLWPDIFERTVPAPVRPLGKLLFAPFSHQANLACSSADAIVGVNDAFCQWGVDRAHRVRRVDDQSFPLAYDASAVSDAQRADAESGWRELGVRPADLVVAFVGSFTRQFEFKPLVAAARTISARRPELKFVLCGAGPLLAEVEKAVGDAPNVVLPGWVDAPRLSWLLTHAAVGVAPYLPNPDFEANYPNKVVEYLAHGLPVVTSLGRGATAELLDQRRCGAVYDVRDPASLTDAIMAFVDDPGRRAEASANAREVFAEHFDAKAVYPRFVDLLERLAARAAVTA